MNRSSATAIHFDTKSLTSAKKRRVSLLCRRAIISIRQLFTAKNAKILLLTLIWLITTVIFIAKPENHLTFYNTYVPPNSNKSKYKKFYKNRC